MKRKRYRGSRGYDGLRPGGRTLGPGAVLVKLFRDRQLVAQLDLDAAQLRQFETEGQISLTIEALTLPADRAQVTFSAYAFNDDGIKSETAHRTLARATPRAISQSAYVLAVGVDRYDNPDWNLRHAASDAEATAALIAQGLRQTGSYEAVHTVYLVSRLKADAAPRLARRDMITATLQRLAGRPLSVDLPHDLHRHLPDLPPVHPQDVVYLAFAGHGLGTPDGRFHFFPQEFGQGQSDRHLNAEALTGTLDSDLLAKLLMQIDARNMVLVIDACNAAASVEGDGFWPPRRPRLWHSRATV